MADEKRCPYCAEIIEGTEEKCPHCGEKLGDTEKIEIEIKPKNTTQENSLPPQHPQSKKQTPITKFIHNVTLWACVIAFFSGCGILFAGEIGIADITINLIYWVMAIFFLLVWKFTE
ncbi:MAG: zinc ribbon domain-containing protein [Muribaculaceae bacterium]|nr:zinc ribbon domain-containing protein [Muribaculaceae bacterium]